MEDHGAIIASAEVPTESAKFGELARGAVLRGLATVVVVGANVVLFDTLGQPRHR